MKGCQLRSKRVNDTLLYFPGGTPVSHAKYRVHCSRGLPVMRYMYICPAL